MTGRSQKSDMDPKKVTNQIATRTINTVRDNEGALGRTTAAESAAGGVPRPGTQGLGRTRAMAIRSDVMVALASAGLRLAIQMAQPWTAMVSQGEDLASRTAVSLGWTA